MSESSRIHGLSMAEEARSLVALEIECLIYYGASVVKKAPLKL